MWPVSYSLVIFCIFCCCCCSKWALSIKVKRTRKFSALRYITRPHNTHVCMQWLIAKSVWASHLSALLYISYHLLKCFSMYCYFHARRRTEVIPTYFEPGSSSRLLSRQL